uniref:Uncharacterized protein n=1 Tax=Avena sativa TaxID=4498 RepID=A0ACD5T828_AVESA
MDASYPPARQASGKRTASPLPSHGRASNPTTVPPHAASFRDGGAPHDAAALRAVLKRLATASSPVPGQDAPKLHAHATKLGLDRRHRGVRDALVALYLACGRRGAARALFGGDPAPDVVSWTSLVTGNVRLGLYREAATLFLAMADDGAVVVDAVAAAGAFAACSGAGDLALAREVHRRVLVAVVALDVVACNALVDMYAKCGDAAAALRCFRAMTPAKNVVTWNTMISAHARAGEPREALSLFREMLEQQGVRPDDATFVAVLGACARLGALDAGMWVHAHYARRTGRNAAADGVVGNALLDMYAKCGAVEQAAEVFDAMARRDVYTYTSMISGLAAHGRGEDALALFANMHRVGIRPNKVTFLSVLSACCHAGFVEDGLRHLDAMSEVHGVAPGVEHYGCVVDMLGRAGRLDEAEELIAAMPVRPDAPIWGSLLSACRAHGHVERAERVMRRIAGEDADAGDYVLMSNMYAREGRHGKAVRVRREMRRSKVDKVPGCSLIEIDGVVHEFQAVPANSGEFC